MNSGCREISVVHTALTGETEAWYPLRVTYSREIQVKRRLDEAGVRNFVPMRWTETERGGRRIRLRVPAVHNLLFIRACESDMRRIKSSSALPIRYMMDRETRRPLVVPDKQMADFIAVAGSDCQETVWLDPASPALSAGDRVRVASGPLAGVEGMLVRVKGDRRVAVVIEGVAAVATAFISPRLLDKLA